jgi:hypothetical protein
MTDASLSPGESKTVSNAAHMMTLVTFSRARYLSASTAVFLHCSCADIWNLPWHPTIEFLVF